MSEREQPREGQEEALQTIVDLGSSVIRTDRGSIYVLTIVGQIEGHHSLPPESKSTRYEHVLPLLAMVEGNRTIDGLLILLNNSGGDVEAGLAIAELIASMTKPTVSLVLGGSHSIGVPLAVSAKRSFIAPSGAMTIHPVRLSGLVIGAPQTYCYFERIQERIVRFVVDNSAINSEDFRRLMMNTGEVVMDVGTVLDGEAAVDCGLIDHLGGLHEAIQCLYSMIEDGEEDTNADS